MAAKKPVPKKPSPATKADQPVNAVPRSAVVPNIPKAKPADFGGGVQYPAIPNDLTAKKKKKPPVRFA